MTNGTTEPADSFSDGGMAADHGTQSGIPAAVATSTNSHYNTLRIPLTAVACWRMDDVRFEFDSSFIMPEAKLEFLHFAKIRKAHPDCPASIFGHADPTGMDDYNKILSGRRARAVYGLLTRKVEIWEDLYKKPFQGDSWGNKSIQRMLAALGYYQGTIDGIMGADTRKAAEEFQGGPEGRAAGLEVDGDVGKNTRPVLFKAYMDFLCTDASGNPYQLDPSKDFIARGADATTLKGDIQACGEFNPVLLFSKEDEDRFKKPANKSERDAANAPNRRVVAFLFEKHSRVDPEKWPCPKISLGQSDAAGIAACRLHFFTDHEQRRGTHLPGAQREYKKTQDTFACRTYDRLARFSPCEAGFKEWLLRLLKTGAGGIDKRDPYANEPYTVSGAGAGGEEVRGSTSASGMLRLRVRADRCTMVLKVAGCEITLQGGLLPESGTGDDAVKHRLLNLGYGKAKLEEWTDAVYRGAIRSFRKDHGLPEGDAVDDAFNEKLRQMHGS